jgi:MHS family proline/betaine transporter-like MFS transporter
VLEWYDFMLYGYFAPVIATLFFPSTEPSLSLMSAFAVFSVGFLARPMGAVLFGHWGDTRGRRDALVWSMILMAVPTCALGLLPTYDQIGWAAPLALTALRFLQGLSVGGELTGSVTFLVEHAPPSRQGAVGSWAGFSAQLGALLGSLAGTVAVAGLTEEALQQWGWRIPFVTGSAIALVGWYVRRRIPESPEFERLHRAGTVSASPARDVWVSHKIPAVQVIGLVLLHGVGFYMIYVFLPTYLTAMTTLSRAAVLAVNTACMSLIALLIPIMGWLSDRVGHTRLLLIGATGLALGAVPLFTCFTGDRLIGPATAYVLMTVLLSCYMGPFFAVVANLFPTPHRYTGLSVGYNVASAVFGGTAPLIATVITQWSGNALAPGIYLAVCAGISLLVVSTIRPSA